jgi:prepilin-type N-terminal cleavage/methylation domain-containing protein
MTSKKGFTLIELLVVIVIIGILVAIALPNFIRIKDKAKEAEVKQNCHAIQLGVERYAVDAAGSNYPYILNGGDWTDQLVVWQEWVDLQNQTGEQLDPNAITKYLNAFSGDVWEPAETDVGDTLVMEAYLPAYPANPFVKNKSDTLLPRIHHFPEANLDAEIRFRVVGGRQSDKMFEVFGPIWLLQQQSFAGDYYVHHIYNNPPYDFEGDMFKNPVEGWISPSGNQFLVGNFSYWPRGDDATGWGITGAGDALGYTIAGYGSVRTPGQDVYNRNGNYKGRYRTEGCEIDCPPIGGVYGDDVPCLCGSGAAPNINANDGGSDTILDGVVITLDSGVDKKSARVNVNLVEGS